jgi:hypothetical protein
MTHHQLEIPCPQHGHVHRWIVRMTAVEIFAQGPTASYRVVIATSQWQQAGSLRGWHWRQTGQVCERRRQIQPLHDIAAALSRREVPRPAHDHRHPHRAVVEHRTLQQQLVIAQHFAVVTGKDDYRVVVQAE